MADIVGSHMKAAGLASKPIFRVHRVGAVFVKWHHRNACLGRTAPGEEDTAGHFQREPSGSTHPTPQLGARSGAHRSWERPATEAAQAPGSSITISIPAATALQPPAPAHSTLQPSTRSGTNTVEKGMHTTLGCFWAKPQMLAGTAHMFPGPHLLHWSQPLGQSRQAFKGNRAL